MKQVKAKIWRWGLLCIYILIGVACTDDLGIKSTNQVVREGIPVEVYFNLNAVTSDMVQISRAESGDDLIYDLYVLVFGSDRKLKTVYYRDFSNSLANTQNVRFETTSGESYIFAIANIHNGVPAEYNVDDAYSTLRGLESSGIGVFTIDDLKNVEIKLSQKNTDIVNRTQGRYVMSGKFKPSGDDLGDGYCVIPETNSQLQGEVPLFRTDAKITFNLYTNGTKGEFTPSTFRVANVPLRSRLLNETTDIDGETAVSGQTGDYYTTDDAINITQKVVDAEKGTYHTFTFYMPENRKSAKNSSLNGYHEREQQAKTENEDGSITNGQWVNAPDYGTYVILSGRFIGTDDHGDEIDANVQYKIHLGDFRNQQWANFKTSRNTEYVYNVRVNGVNNIIVEVQTKNTENQPGATGDVYYTNETNLYTLDAHYETCLMTFSYSSLASYNEKGQIGYRVHTPFTDLGADKSADANWVRFKINEKSRNVYSDDLQTYTTSDLLTIDQLIAILEKMATNSNHANWDTNSQFKVTCFVNEFYYSNDKTENGYTEQSTVPQGVNISSGVPAWKYAVNQPNRTLQILCNVTSSADGESSIIDAAYVLSQRSIQTFYNPDITLSGLTSALGVEIVNETSKLPIGTPSNRPEDLRDGLTNTLSMWQSVLNKKWNAYINYASNGYKEPQDYITSDDIVEYIGLQSQYQKAYIACLQRNRDDDGDGFIENEEIKWYMPALNQYAAFFVGAGALSQESRFYTYPDWRLKHYYSSTYADRNGDGMKDNDVMTVWAEEGFSNSTEQQADSWIKTGTTINRYYRCVRNLGNVSTNGAGGKRPQNYWYQDSSNKNLIHFNYLAPAALRQVPISNGELASIHTEQTQQNRIYSSFAIANSDASRTCTGAEARNANTVCASYTENGIGAGKWRVPNHRELLFMTLNGQKGAGALTNFPLYNRGYHCRTLFTWSSVLGSYYSPLDNKIRYGYRIESNGNMSLTEGSTDQLYVRCVRDVVE